MKWENDLTVEKNFVIEKDYNFDARMDVFNVIVRGNLKEEEVRKVVHHLKNNFNELMARYKSLKDDLEKLQKKEEIIRFYKAISEFKDMEYKVERLEKTMNQDAEAKAAEMFNKYVQDFKLKYFDKTFEIGGNHERKN